MRRVFVAVLAAAVALVPYAAFSSHGGPDDNDPRDWAAGGGQVVLDVSNLEAAGDSIGFNATTVLSQGGVEGQVEYVATSLAGEEMDRWNGTVECFEVDGNEATLGGAIDGNQGSNASGRFALRVTDNGTPEDGEGSDVIVLSYGEDTAGDCSEGDFKDADELTLARGNATVHDAE